ncbi:Dabb family protein [Paenibacillus naphthalenovorans]|uniref:Stress responsive protein n=1 Tax=Paenibacillus naphthalenovorans TaxID=162209 RepID=A0A0U2WAS0_9BACL|nr:Dabb family protein [Paenibacillus naphthalenovorans]ALS22458.1 stress responsive protein [Paenibacillus naphthalenovorans]
MITHVVMFKLKDRGPESVKATYDVLKNMEGKIPVLRHIEVGTDVLHLERSYDIVLITKFDSLEDLQVYDNHPVHLEVKAHMKQVLDGTSICVDFES